MLRVNIAYNSYHYKPLHIVSVNDFTRVFTYQSVFTCTVIFIHLKGRDTKRQRQTDTGKTLYHWVTPPMPLTPNRPGRSWEQGIQSGFSIQMTGTHELDPTLAASIGSALAGGWNLKRSGD